MKKPISNVLISAEIRTVMSPKGQKSFLEQYNKNEISKEQLADILIKELKPMIVESISINRNILASKPTDELELCIKNT